MPITLEHVDKLRPLWRTWPDQMQRAWELWLTNGHVAHRHDSSLHPPDSPASAATYARHISYAFNWAIQRGLSSDPAIWTKSLVNELRQHLAAQGMAPTTVRLWLISIERLIAAVDPMRSRDDFRSVLRTIPRRSVVSRKAEGVCDARDLFEFGIASIEEALRVRPE